jgi:hypothetical protein
MFRSLICPFSPVAEHHIFAQGHLERHRLHQRLVLLVMLSLQMVDPWGWNQFLVHPRLPENSTACSTVRTLKDLAAIPSRLPNSEFLHNPGIFSF